MLAVLLKDPFDDNDAPCLSDKSVIFIILPF